MTSTLICVPTTPTAMHVPGTAIGLPDQATTVTVADFRRMSGLAEQYALSSYSITCPAEPHDQQISQSLTGKGSLGACLLVWVP
jgi:hypothetical protein